MLKAIVIAMIASMLFAFPIVFYISTTVKAGNGNEVSVSQEFVAADNTVTGGDITQVSVIQTGDPISGGDSGGDDNGSGDNSGGSDNGGSGDNSGGNDNGGSGDNSGGSYDDGYSMYDSMTAGHPSENSTKSVVINRIYPYSGMSASYGNGEVELYNTGKAPVNINRWYLKNTAGYVIGTVNNIELDPSGFLVVDVTGLTGDNQEVTLFDSEGNSVDSVAYTGAGSHNGLSYARIPDGAGTWKWTALKFEGGL